MEPIDGFPLKFKLIEIGGRVCNPYFESISFFFFFFLCKLPSLCGRPFLVQSTIPFGDVSLMFSSAFVKIVIDYDL